MSYTGTGTQDDPYLVSTFDDLLTCAKIKGAYVKVANDIEGHEVLEFMDFSCARIYADSKKTIRGVTVVGSDFISGQDEEGSDYVEINNLIFEGCTHKKIGSQRTFYGNLHFVNCSVSMQIARSTYGARIMSETVKFTRCALSIEIDGYDTTNWTELGIYNCTECNIYIKNARIYWENAINCAIAQHCTLCSIVLENAYVYNSQSAQWCFFYGCHSVLVAFEQVTFSSNYHRNYKALESSNCLLAINDYNGYIASNSVGMKMIDTTSAKDEDYLISTGFLP